MAKQAFYNCEAKDVGALMHTLLFLINGGIVYTCQYSEQTIKYIEYGTAQLSNEWTNCLRMSSAC